MMSRKELMEHDKQDLIKLVFKIYDDFPYIIHNLKFTAVSIGGQPNKLRNSLLLMDKKDLIDLIIRAQYEYYYLKDEERESVMYKEEEERERVIYQMKKDIVLTFGDCGFLDLLSDDLIEMIYNQTMIDISIKGAQLTNPIKKIIKNKKNKKNRLDENYKKLLAEREMDSLFYGIRHKIEDTCEKNCNIMSSTPYDNTHQNNTSCINKCFNDMINPNSRLDTIKKLQNLKS